VERHVFRVDVVQGRHPSPSCRSERAVIITAQKSSLHGETLIAVAQRESESHTCHIRPVGDRKRRQSTTNKSAGRRHIDRQSQVIRWPNKAKRSQVQTCCPDGGQVPSTVEGDPGRRSAPERGRHHRRRANPESRLDNVQLAMTITNLAGLLGLSRRPGMTCPENDRARQQVCQGFF
jgi:hypothetical protein